MCHPRPFACKQVGVCVDTGHLNLHTNVVKTIAAFSGRIMSVHLQDTRGERDEHLLAGSGSIDWPKVMTALQDTGYEGVLMSEGADADKSPDANAGSFRQRISTFHKSASSRT